MNLYIYYNKHDKTKEPQGKFKATNLEEAIIKASSIKNLNIQDFLKLFKVEQVFKNSTKK